MNEDHQKLTDDERNNGRSEFIAVSLLSRIYQLILVEKFLMSSPRATILWKQTSGSEVSYQLLLHHQNGKKIAQSVLGIISCIEAKDKVASQLQQINLELRSVQKLNK